MTPRLSLTLPMILAGYGVIGTVWNDGPDSNAFAAALPFIFLLLLPAIFFARGVLHDLACAALIATVICLFVTAPETISRTNILILFAWAVVSIIKFNSARQAGVILALFCSLVIAFSPFIMWDRSVEAWQNLRLYQVSDFDTSVAERLTFWKKSIHFIGEAPVFGHGTGSTNKLFHDSTIGQKGLEAIDTHNPHNDTLLVGIQLGVVGMVLLWAMWVSHLMLFRGPGFYQWAGTCVVVSNIIGSAFNNYLLEINHGLFYVLGVGIAGAGVLRERHAG